MPESTVNLFLFLPFFFFFSLQILRPTVLESQGAECENHSSGSVTARTRGSVPPQWKGQGGGSPGMAESGNQINANSVGKIKFLWV